MSLAELSEQEIIRRNSLNELKNLGINAYPAPEFKVTHLSKEILNKFEKSPEELQEVVIAGRMMSRRIMGKASFFELQDAEGRIQVYVSRDDVSRDEACTMYNTVFKKLMDIGDIVGVKGFVFRTNMGEISVHAKELVMLSKSLRPLPIVKEKDGKVFDAFTGIKISSALFGFNRESAGEGCVYQAYEDDQRHPSILHGNGLFGGGDSGVAGYTGRGFGASVYHAS